MEMFKLFPRFCVLVHAFHAALRIYFTNIKSPSVEVNNFQFTIINFTNIHITTVPRPLLQPTTTNDSYLFTLLLILHGGQAGEFSETSKIGMFILLTKGNVSHFSP
jgi:hypothetical protein